MFSSAVDLFHANKAKSSGGMTKIEELRQMILDEDLHVMTSFELNQFASLTFHESSVADGTDLCEQMFETLCDMLQNATRYTPLALQKALVVCRHLLTYGAERVINEGICLGRPVEHLLNYNTVLLAQQQQGAVGVLMRIKGGGVDKGGPVREEASKVHRMLSDINFLRAERERKADPTSLVPIGDKSKVGFLTDELRLYVLKKRMEEEQTIQVRSNLAKADGAFGAGYNAKDGKSVVGASHGLEEMMKIAQREQNKFSDDGPVGTKQASNFSCYQPPMEDLLSTSQRNEHKTSIVAQETDLLDFSSSPAPATSNNTMDLLGVASEQKPANDLLALDSLPTMTAHTDATNNSSARDVWSSTDLISGLSLGGSANIDTGACELSKPESDLLTEAVVSVPAPLPMSPLQPEKKPVMASSMSSSSSLGLINGNKDTEDRFAALDALVGDSSNGMSTPMSMSDSLSSSLRGSGAGTSDLSSSLTMMGQPQLPFAGNTLNGGLAAMSNPILNPSTIDTSSLKISTMNGGGTVATTQSEDDENGFVMGGSEGTGLTPFAPAPSSAPPPPPPS